MPIKNNPEMTVPSVGNKEADQMNEAVTFENSKIWGEDVGEKVGLTAEEWKEIELPRYTYASPSVDRNRPENVLTAERLEVLAVHRKNVIAGKRGVATKLNNQIQKAYGGDESKNPNLTYKEWKAIEFHEAMKLPTKSPKKPKRSAAIPEDGDTEAGDGRDPETTNRSNQQDRVRAEQDGLDRQQAREQDRLDREQARESRNAQQEREARRAEREGSDRRQQDRDRRERERERERERRDRDRQGNSRTREGQDRGGDRQNQRGADENGDRQPNGRQDPRHRDQNDGNGQPEQVPAPIAQTEEQLRATEIRQLNGELIRLEQETENAEKKYAVLTAGQRSAHIGRLAQGGRVKRVFRSIGSRLPLVGRLINRHTDSDKNIEAARTKLEEKRLEAADVADKLMERQGHSLEDRRLVGILGQAEKMRRLHGFIEEESDKEAVKNSKFGKWLTKQWAGSGRIKKAAMIAVPALATGFSFGAAAGIIGLSGIGLGAAGLGSSFAGRRLGAGVADKVNRGFSGTKEGKKALDDELALGLKALDDRNGRSGEGDSTTYAPTEEYFNDTNLTEKSTIKQVNHNRSRANRSKTLGSIVAATGFAVGLSAIAGPGGESVSHSSIDSNSNSNLNAGVNPTENYITTMQLNSENVINLNPNKGMTDALIQLYPKLNPEQSYGAYQHLETLFKSGNLPDGIFNGVGNQTYYIQNFAASNPLDSYDLGFSAVKSGPGALTGNARRAVEVWMNSKNIL